MIIIYRHLFNVLISKSTYDFTGIMALNACIKGTYTILIKSY